MIAARFAAAITRKRHADTGSGRSRVRGGALLAAAFVAASLAACGRADEQPSLTPAPATPAISRLPRSDDPTPTGSGNQPFSGAAGSPGAVAPAGSIVWTIESDPATGAPLAQLERIAPDAPRIVASLPVSLGASPAVAAAAWSYNNTPMPAFDGSVQIPAGEGAMWVSFVLEAPAGSAWPVGAYQLLVSIDGKPAAIGAVEVRAAE